MADYTRYKTETLKKMRDAAWEKYCAELEKPGDGWGAGFRHWKLRDYKGFEKSRDRYYAICAELKRREELERELSDKPAGEITPQGAEEAPTEADEYPQCIIPGA